MEYTMNSGAASARQRKNAFRMEKRRRLGLPRYTLGEEIFSSVSHGVSACLPWGRWCFCCSPAKKRPCA